MSLWVGSLGGLRHKDLRKHFKKYGHCEVLLKSRETGSLSIRSQSYAFIDYDDPKDAEDAIMDTKGREIAGRTISVSWSHRARKRGGPARRRYDDSSSSRSRSRRKRRRRRYDSSESSRSRSRSRSRRRRRRRRRKSKTVTSRSRSIISRSKSKPMLADKLGFNSAINNEAVGVPAHNLV